MNALDIKRRNLFSVGPHLFGLIFIAVGLFTVLSPMFIQSDNTVLKSILVGSAFIVIGLMSIASYGGTHFDFTEKKYREYYSISGFRIGKWQPIPAIKTIKVFPHSYTANRVFDGIHPSTTQTVDLHVIALFADKSTPVLVFENNSKDKAVRDAKIISEQLKAELDNKSE